MKISLSSVQVWPRTSRAAITSSAWAGSISTKDPLIDVSYERP
jgi:hypothetical protein